MAYKGLLIQPPYFSSFEEEAIDGIIKRSLGKLDQIQEIRSKIDTYVATNRYIVNSKCPYLYSYIDLADEVLHSFAHVGLTNLFRDIEHKARSYAFLELLFIDTDLFKVPLNSTQVNDAKVADTKVNDTKFDFSELFKDHSLIGPEPEIDFTKFYNYVYEQVTAKEKSVAKVLTVLQRILVDLEAEKLPSLSLEPVNFVTNNKLPAPDDEAPKRTRLPISMAEELADLLDLTDKEMANLLTISIRTYHRLKHNGLLNPVASERLTLLKELAVYGAEVFEEQANFNKWLRLPLSDLSNSTPLNSLDTATGINRVKTILDRIEYGVYS